MKQWLQAGMAGALLMAGGAGCAHFSDRPAPAGVSAAAEPAEPVRWVRRPHLTFRSEAEADGYRTLAARRQKVLDDQRVLLDLLQQKATGYSALTAQMEKDYKITPGMKCSYDGKTRSLLAMEDDGKGGFVKRVLMVLEKPEEEKKLAGLLDRRRREMGQLAAIHGALMKSKAEQAEVQRRLLAAYGVSADREYELEPKTLLLVEKIAVPKGFELEGNP